MAELYGLMVPGATSGSPAIDVLSPYNRRKIGRVATADEAVAEHALKTAYALYRDRNAWLPAWRRVDILERTVEIMTKRAKYLALEAAREGGKPLTDSQHEVARAIDGVKLCIEALRTQAGEEIPMGISRSSVHRLAFTSLEPIGVVTAVSAFNHPLNLIIHQVCPAVAVGCPVIVKPSEETPLSCMRFVKILREAGLPDEWCQPLVASELAVSEKIVTDPRVGFFSFIGSAGVGWMLRSKLAPGTRCALEHGGVAPVIMAADADVKRALPLLAKGGFYHAGQVCVSVQRIFAHRSIANAVARGLAKQAKALKVGDPTKPSTEVGPLIRPREVDRVAEWVEEARAGGAKVLAGGKRLSKTCYAPTVLWDPPRNARVSRNEVFGPVVCVYPYRTLDQAIARANSLDVSFQAAVFTQDLDTALRVYKRLDASAVMLNDHTAFRVDWMPFAGLKHSGHGTGGIHHTMEEMQIKKMMVLNSPQL
jgi:acyl-CoA reductase-like NAD-dependent aldehyde dehydrogenase